MKIDACRLTANISEVAAYYARPLEEASAKENWNDLPRAAWKQVTASPLVIDLGKAVEMAGFVYAPANAEAKPTMAFRYKFYVSTNGEDWKEVPTTGSSATLCITLFRRPFRSATRSVPATSNSMPLHRTLPGKGRFERNRYPFAEVSRSIEQLLRVICLNIRY